MQACGRGGVTWTTSLPGRTVAARARLAVVRADAQSVLRSGRAPAVAPAQAHSADQACALRASRTLADGSTARRPPRSDRTQRPVPGARFRYAAEISPAAPLSPASSSSFNSVHAAAQVAAPTPGPANEHYLYPRCGRGLTWRRWWMSTLRSARGELPSSVSHPVATRTAIAFFSAGGTLGSGGLGSWGEPVAAPFALSDHHGPAHDRSGVGEGVRAAHSGYAVRAHRLGC